jgi:chemotaxis protein MotB
VADTQIKEFKEAVESRDDVIAGQNKEIAAQKKEIASLQSRVTAAGESSDQVKQLQANLEKKDQQIAQLKKQLATAGESEPAAPAARALDASLRKARQQLTEALKPQIDAGEAEVMEKDGAIVLRLQSDLLFETATVMIRSSAKSVLDQVAEVLAQYPNYHLRVEGHTDSQPVRSMPFPDNLALSSQRAGNIVRYLVQRGRLPEGQMEITSAGRSYWDPIATNDTADGRQKNRRVEIVLEPKA